jgi:hypothetical protein
MNLSSWKKNVIKNLNICKNVLDNFFPLARQFDTDKDVPSFFKTINTSVVGYFLYLFQQVIK